jgi:hypothetical protein
MQASATLTVRLETGIKDMEGNRLKRLAAAGKSAQIDSDSHLWQCY